MKKLHPTVMSLLTEIEQYCARSGTDPTNFGLEALNDGHFIRRLYLGRMPTLPTIDRVHEFIHRKTKAVPLKKARR